MWNFTRKLASSSEERLAKSAINQTVRTFVQTLAEKSQPVYIGTWDHFTEWFDKQYPDKCMTRLTSLEAELFMKHYGARPGQASRVGGTPHLSPTTLKKVAATLSRLYRAVFDEHGIEARNPWVPVFQKYKGAKSKTRRPTELTPYEKVLELVRSPDNGTPAGLRDSAILSMLYGGGLRRGEVVKLRMSDVSLDGGTRVTVHLRETKNGDDDMQGLAPWAGAIVKRFYLQRAKEGAQSLDPLFIEYRGAHQVKRMTKPLGETTVYKIHKRCCKDVGLPSTISTHSGRATAITMLLDKGVSHREVRKFSRHRSINMVEWYDKKRSDEKLDPSAQLTFDEE